MKENSNLPASLLEHIPWENGVNPIWPASVFVLRRNVNKTLFPSKMNATQCQQTFSLLSDTLLNNPGLDKPLLLKADTISALEKEYLFEHFLCLEGFQNTGAHQGFVVDQTSHFLARLNQEDHLHLYLVDSKGGWESAWNTLNQIDNAIADRLEYAFQPRFGYLSSDPAHCGTGLTIYIFLHLPALIHTGQLTDTLAKISDEEITATGIQGNLDELIADLLVLHNTYSLGVNEENILHALHGAAMKLMALEKTLRAHIQSSDDREMKDHVCRAFGLLIHSYQLQTKEALGALSLLILGLDLGWIGGVKRETLHQAFFICRRAHLLLSLAQTPPNEQEIPRKRAEHLHQLLHGITLNIEN